MRKMILAAMLVMAAFNVSGQEKTRQERLVDHVYYFASDSLRGRKAGSEDAAKAAEYIRKEYESAGLKPYFSDWYMHFGREGKDYVNVVGCIEGSDPVLRNEFIVLGAHYDHLGMDGDVVYNGADDNASGSAALIEVAGMLARDPRQLKRSIIIAAFDAEEIGLYGSSALADSLRKRHVDVKLMMSLDMVGWLREGKALTMEGTATIKNGRTLLEAEAAKTGITINPKRFETSIMTATDTDGFANMAVPTLAVTTGLKSPYHKPEDDAELIDYAGLELVTDYIAGLTSEIASSDSFEASGRLSFKHRVKSDYGLDIMPAVQFGDNWVRYRDARLTGDARYSVAAGLGMRFSMRRIALTAEGLAGYETTRLIDDSDVYGSSLIMKRSYVKVPVCLTYRTPRHSHAGAEIGVGAYWSQTLSEEKGSGCIYDLEKNPVGAVVRLSTNVYKFRFGVDLSYQLNNLYTGENAPKARKNEAAVFFGLIF